MLLLTLTSCGKERTEDISKLEMRDEKIYIIGEDKPYTGTLIDKYENGNLGKIAEFKNGLRHGKQETYDKNGQLNGPYNSYYENGNLKTEATYRNGKEDGPIRVYYENGQLWSESKYKNGVEVAPIKWYDENGNPKPSL